MKKRLPIFLMIMVMIIMPFIIAMPALAAEPVAVIEQAEVKTQSQPAAIETMAATQATVADPGGGELFTWTVLATYAGAVAATIVITQIFKGIGFIDKIPTRIFSYVVAFVIMLLAKAFTEGLTAAAVVLVIINAAVVSTAANGTVDAYNQAANKNNNTDMNIM